MTQGTALCALPLSFPLTFSGNAVLQCMQDGVLLCAEIGNFAQFFEFFYTFPFFVQKRLALNVFYWYYISKRK